MKSSNKLLLFDFKMNWKWHLYMYPVMIAITFIVLHYGINTSLKDYFNEPVLSVDILYLLAMSGMFMTFMFREGYIPKREKSNHYTIQMVYYLRSLPINHKTIVHYYFRKYLISTFICIIIVGFLLYPDWKAYFNLSEYILFLIFWLGMGSFVGLFSISFFPVKRVLELSIISIVISIISLFIIILIFYKFYDTGVVGFIVEAIKDYHIVLPMISIVIGVTTYPLAHKNMVRLFERRDL